MTRENRPIWGMGLVLTVISARYAGITRSSEEFSLNLRDQVSARLLVRSVTRGEEREVEVYVVEKRGIYQLPWLEAESLHMD